MVQFVVSSAVFCIGYMYCNVLAVSISSVSIVCLLTVVAVAVAVAVAVQLGHPYVVSHKRHFRNFLNEFSNRPS
jgi:uncharacterized protein YacL